MNIPIEISARHIHLCQEDLERLFGKNYKLKKIKEISQPGQYACEEKITLVNGDRSIENVRIVGPIRAITQIEISKTDAVKLKVDPPIRISGDITGSTGINLKSIEKEINIKEGLIIAKRHLHISPNDAKKYNIKNGDKISVKTSGERSLVFNEIIVRSHEKIDELGLHLDTDEANAANLSQNDKGEIINE